MYETSFWPTTNKTQTDELLLPPASKQQKQKQSNSNSNSNGFNFHSQPTTVSWSSWRLKGQRDFVGIRSPLRLPNVFPATPPTSLPFHHLQLQLHLQPLQLQLHPLATSCHHFSPTPPTNIWWSSL